MTKQAMNIRDLSVRPGKEVLEALLTTRESQWTREYNAFWNILDGTVEIKPYIKSSTGVPIFKSGLKDIKGMDKRAVLEQFQKATYRRIRYMVDWIDHRDNGYMHPERMAQRIFDGYILIDELGPIYTRDLLERLMVKSDPEFTMKFIDLMTPHQVHGIMDQLNAWQVGLFPLLDPTKIQHVMLAAGMLRGMDGLRANERQTAIFITFINSVIELKKNGKINDDNVDVVFEITQSAQKMEWVINEQTYHELEKIQPGGDHITSIHKARDFWLIKEFKVASRVRDQ